MTDTARTTKPGRKGRRETPPAKPQTAKPEVTRPRATKLDQLTALLARDGGASIAEMMEATGWRAHSVRGALAGSLKRRGLAIVSDKADGVRRYRSATAK